MISLAEQAAKGLAYVHIKNYVHKDIKPVNFVVRRGLEEKGEPKWVCKLTDLGFSRRIVEGGSCCHPTKRVGTRDWIAPEVLKKFGPVEEDNTVNISEEAFEGLPFSKKSDVWAMGCVLHFIFTKSHPYGETVKDRLQNIEKCQPMELSNNLPGTFIAEMIQAEPENRPIMDKVIEQIQQWTPSSASNGHKKSAVVAKNNAIIHLPLKYTALLLLFTALVVAFLVFCFSRRL